MNEIRMAIIRPLGLPISNHFYNSQEIGLARGLSLLGIDVDVFVAGNSSEVSTRVVSSLGHGRVRLIEVPFFKIPAIDHALYPKLAKLLKTGNYNFIQVNEENELTSFYVARLARLQGIPVVVYQGMYEPLSGRLRAAFQKCYDRLLLPSFRRYVTVALAKTSRARQHLERKGFTRTRVVPVGLDPLPFAERIDRDWRLDLDIPGNSPILLYVGIFEKRRNVDFMVNLAKALSDQEVALVMAGTGPEHARIADRIKKEAIRNVKLTGPVAQKSLPSLYEQSSLFLLPSNYEIYGMVVLEAMYFGLPVISTRTAGPEEIIGHEEDGFLIGKLDAGEWCNVIRRLLNHRQSLARMSLAAKGKIRGQLLWEKVARNYADFIIAPIL